MTVIITPRRSSQPHFSQTSSTVSNSQPAKLEFAATRSKLSPLTFSNSQLFLLFLVRLSCTRIFSVPASLGAQSPLHLPSRITNHKSPLTAHTTPSPQLPSLPAPSLCYSHRVPPNGLRAIAPTRPMASGSLPLFPAKEVILCAF